MDRMDASCLMCVRRMASACGSALTLTSSTTAFGAAYGLISVDTVVLPSRLPFSAGRYTLPRRPRVSVAWRKRSVSRCKAAKLVGNREEESMKAVLVASLAALVSLAPQVCSADANDISVSQSIKINAPPDAVWEVLGDFGGLPRWLSFVEACQIVAGTNNEVGAIRLVT